MTRNNGIWTWFSGLTFKNKLLTVFIPLILVALSVLGILSSQLLGRSLINRSVNDVVDESDLIINKLDSITKNAEICSNMLVTDVNRLYENFPVKRNDLEETKFRSTMQSRLAIDLSLFPETDAAVFVDSSGNIYTSYSARNDESRVLQSGMIEQLVRQGSYGAGYWFPMEKRGFITPDAGVPVLTLGKVVTDITTGDMYGTLFLVIKEPTLSAYLGGSDKFGQKNYYLVDSRDMIVASPDKGQVLTKVERPSELELLAKADQSRGTVTKNEAGKRLITVSDYPGMNWKLLNVVDLRILTKDIGTNIRLILLIGLCCLVLSVLGAHLLSKAVLSPLQQLVKTMRRVMEGNLDAQAPVQTRDEIGLISRVFNSMVGQLKTLLQTMETEQMQKREYELALITSQVKPHFLYNTLDTIYILNDMDRNQEARDTTKALADFYRVVLSKGRELIILEQEIKMTSDYLAIMQIRYPDIFSYEIKVADELKGTPIPKLSLQPIVENAIYHGLKTKTDPGTIRITAITEPGRLLIRVEDDGVGMSAERLETITAAFDSGKKDMKSIGIYSVNERIKLYFGPQYGINIYSEEGQGTRVELALPGRTGGA